MASKIPATQRERSAKRTRQGGDLKLRIGTLNEDERSIESVISTDSPVRMFGENEILTIKGMKIRGGEETVVLLNAHKSADVEDIRGLVTDIREEGGQLIGKLNFDDDEKSLRAFAKVKSKSLRCVSVGYDVLEETYVRKGESLDIDGRSYQGPAYVVTSWELGELSIVPIGADTKAKMLRQEPEFTTPNPTTTEVENVTQPNTPETPAPATPAPDVAAEQKRAAEQARRQERARIADLTAAARAARMSNEDLNAAIEDDATTVEAFQKRCLDLISERSKPQSTPKGDIPVQVTRNAVDGLVMRASQAIVLSRYPKAKIEGITPEQEQLARQGGGSLHRHLRSIAVELGDMALATAAPYELINGFLNKRSSNHTTSVLSNIVLDAQNKSIRAGYDLANVVWPTITSIRNVNDFKTINSLSLSNAGPLPEVSEAGEYAQGLLKDGKETYRVIRHGRILTITRETLVNDDMGALTQTPFMEGQSGALTVELMVLSFIHGVGQLMADGLALFSTANANYTSTGTALSVASLNVGINAVATQKDANDNVLGLIPTILLTSTAKDATARQLINSEVDPASSGTALNPYRGRFGVVTSAQLSAGFTRTSGGTKTTYAAQPNGWYLITDPSVAPAIELAGIGGSITPRIEQEMEFNSDGLKNKTVLEVGGRVLDHRFIYKNNGA
jgi:hypothetical protein